MEGGGTRIVAVVGERDDLSHTGNRRDRV
jgi:hypothetical protein